MDWKKEVEFQKEQLLGMLYLSKSDLIILAVCFGLSATICAMALGLNLVIN